MSDDRDRPFTGEGEIDAPFPNARPYRKGYCLTDPPLWYCLQPPPQFWYCLLPPEVCCADEPHTLIAHLWTAEEIVDPYTDQGEFLVTKTEEWYWEGQKLLSAHCVGTRWRVRLLCSAAPGPEGYELQVSCNDWEMYFNATAPTNGEGSGPATCDPFDVSFFDRGITEGPGAAGCECAKKFTLSFSRVPTAWYCVQSPD